MEKYIVIEVVNMAPGLACVKFTLYLPSDGVDDPKAAGRTMAAFA